MLCVELLCHMNIKTDTRDSYGKTALDIAIENDFKDIEDILLSKGGSGGCGVGRQKSVPFKVKNDLEEPVHLL